MDGSDLAALVEFGELMYVFLHLSHRNVLDSIDLSSSGTKVTFRPPNACEGTKANPYNLTQLFMVSMHCLWMYDYILTLGDEVRHPCIFRPKCSILTLTQIKFAWSGRKSWGKLVSASPQCPIVHTAAQ